MKIFKTKFTILFLMGILFASANLFSQADDSYVQNIRDEMLIKWPYNRTINFVFHGHSVPSGYYTGGNVYKFGAYPHLALEQIKDKHPYAVLNSITTSIGGEQAERGETRFAREVLTMRPDVLFIDYALNDRGIGLERAKVAWQKMIDAALAHTFIDRDSNVHSVKVYLMTPTPDTNEDILSDDSPLAQHAAQIRQLAKDNNVGLIDSYTLFKEIASRESLSSYMAQNNHVNAKGHQVVANEIAKLFLKEEVVDDGLYYIKGNYSQRFWTVKDGLSDVNTQIVINDSLGTDNQKFYVKETTNGYFITPYYNNKALGMQDAVTANGANLVLLDSTGVANERFSFTYAGDGHFWITNNNSSIYLATPGTEKENGTKVFQWQFYNNPNFQWKFIPAEETPTSTNIESSSIEEMVSIFPNPTEGHISIINASSSSLLMDIFSIEGKHYLQQALSSERTDFSLPKEMQAGMYLFAFMDTNKNQSFVKKVLLQSSVD